MDKITQKKLIQRLCTLSKLKDHPSANDYGKGIAEMARLFVSILTSRSNSMEFRDAMENIKSKAKSAEINLEKETV